MYSIDFSWEENGFDILSNWMPDVIEDLDSMLRFSKSQQLYLSSDKDCNGLF